MRSLAGLKADDAAEGANPDLTAALSKLMTMMEDVTLTVTTDDIRAELYRTLEFGRLDRLYREGCRGDFAKYPQPLPAGFTTDDLFETISTALSLLNSQKTIGADQVEDWTAILREFAALVGFGIIKQGTADAVAAKRTASLPKWRGSDARQIQMARGA